MGKTLKRDRGLSVSRKIALNIQQDKSMFMRFNKADLKIIEKLQHKRKFRFLK